MNRTVLSILALGAAGAVAAQTQAPQTAAPQAPAAAAPAQVVSTGASGPARVGVINVERLIQESALGKEAFGRVRRLNDQKKDEADKMAKELREMEQKLADQGQSLADDKREQLQKTYQEKAISYKRFGDDAQRVLEEAQKKELQQLENRVLPVIQQVGKEKGYTLIFNKYSGALVYADDGVDITDEVLRRFNTTVAVPEKADTAPKPAAKPATTKKPAGN
jgi:outer membrane protein